MDFSSELPNGTSYSGLHIRTKALQCKPLLISREKPLTFKVRHLLLLSEEASNCIVFGIEVYVYLTFREATLEQHVFISKADTTGLGRHRFSAAGVTRIFLQYLIKLDPKVYLNDASYSNSEADAKKRRIIENEQKSDNQAVTPRAHLVPQTARNLRVLSRKLRCDPSFFNQLFNKTNEVTISNDSKCEYPAAMPKFLQTRVSLFTKAADAYLFPSSQKNEGKHVNDGNNLFKWWISILKYILDDSWSCRADIPGSDHASVQKYIPPKRNWKMGSIYVSKFCNDRAVYTIPLFPDDPKGRFLEHLIVENRYKSLSTSHFWRELGFRQEFRLGNVVGIIGCVKTTTSISGTQEFKQTTVLCLKHYKKLRDVIKCEAYDNIEAVQDLWSSGIKNLAVRLGANLQQITVVGSKLHPSPHSSSITEASLNSRSAVNILRVKKKARPENNINR